MARRRRRNWLERAAAHRALLVTALVGAALLGSTRPARACSLEPIIFHDSSPTLQASDGTPPSTPVVTQTEVYRSKGEHCSGGQCVSSSCGDETTLLIEFQGGQDDQAASHEVGYGLEVLFGTMPGDPEQLRPRLVTNGSMFLKHIAFDDLPQLDADVRLIAVDKAGNRSASEPFRLEYTGCTKSPIDDECMEPEASALGCSLRASGAAGSAGMGWVLLLPFVARARRCARERARR
jgi:hypothetical protein